MWCQGVKASLLARIPAGQSLLHSRLRSLHALSQRARRRRRALGSHVHLLPSPSAKRFPPARPRAGNRAGRAPLTSHRHLPGVQPRPLLPQGGHGHGHIPPLSLQTPPLPVVPRSCVCGTGIALSAVGNHGLASWEGVRGRGAPRRAALPAAHRAGPETLPLLPSQAPLSACHQNSIPSASPAVFGHSSLPPLKEQLVVAAYVSVCRVREGGGERGHLNRFCS